MRRPLAGLPVALPYQTSGLGCFSSTVRGSVGPAFAAGFSGFVLLASSPAEAAEGRLTPKLGAARRGSRCPRCQRTDPQPWRSRAWRQPLTLSLGPALAGSAKAVLSHAAGRHDLLAQAGPSWRCHVGMASPLPSCSGGVDSHGRDRRQRRCHRASAPHRRASAVASGALVGLWIAAALVHRPDALHLRSCAPGRLGQPAPETVARRRADLRRRAEFRGGVCRCRLPQGPRQ